MNGVKLLTRKLSSGGPSFWLHQQPEPPRTPSAPRFYYPLTSAVSMACNSDPSELTNDSSRCTVSSLTAQRCSIQRATRAGTFKFFTRCIDLYGPPVHSGDIPAFFATLTLNLPFEVPSRSKDCREKTIKVAVWLTGGNGGGIEEFDCLQTRILQYQPES
jgi:hypothetical protein